MSEPVSAATGSAGVSLLSPHGSVLVCLARNSEMRPAQIAAAVGITDRAARRVLAELVEARYLRVERTGRVTTHSLVSGDLRNGLLEVARLASTEPENARAGSRREDIRAQLLVAVEALYAGGVAFADISVERLITAAGTSRSTFYTYFQSKDELLGAWIVDIGTRLVAAAEEAPPTTHRLTRADLRDRIEHLVGSGSLQRLSLVAAAAAAGGAREQHDALMLTARTLARDYIARGQSAGAITASLDGDHIAALLTWGIELRLTKGVADDAERERVLDSLTELVWNLLYGDGC